MKILCKYPTRGRPTHFLERIKEWTSLAIVPSKTAWLVSYDEDDDTMTPDVISSAESLHPSVVCVKGNNKSKIEACNADIKDYEADWDIVLLVSDDFFCRRQGWDEMIRKHMTETFPDTNGALWFWDGAQKKINTLECVGRKRWQDFGYLYHPSYFSFFCDNESSEVGVGDGKLMFIPESICTHEHPSWCGGMKKDATYLRNNKYWSQDEANYHRRKQLGFPP